MNTIIKGNIEVVDQLRLCIEQLTNTGYSSPQPPFFSSSVGQHLRHVLDCYLALRNTAQTGKADYDVRHRGQEMEHCRQTGLKALAELRQWLVSLPESALEKSCAIKTEMLLSEPVPVEVSTTMARELCFAALHLTHHQAMIAALIRVQGGTVPETLGLAPATASFLRSTANQTDHSKAQERRSD